MTAATPASRLALLGGLANVVLALIKLVAGVLGHSYALIADAIESLGDIAGSVIIWGGLHISARPRSARHPYGYGKAESLAALVVALLIMAAGIGIAVEAIREILIPHHAPEWWTLLVLIVVVATKEVLYRVTSRAAAPTTEGGSSTALAADAFHHRADAITSLLALVGISIALIGGKGWEPADDWAALCAAAVILFNAVRLAALPARELLDVQEESIVGSAADAAARVNGVRRVQKAFARKSGTRYWIDMHIWVDPSLSVREAHAIAHRVKDAVRAVLPAVEDVLIHIEPDAA